MSFRQLSLIFITALLSSIMLLQWWSITSFSQDISKKVGESAFEVSRTTAKTLIFEQPKVEVVSYSIGNQVVELDTAVMRQAVSSIKQDVFIQLIDEQKDDHLILTADQQQWQIPIPRTGIDESLEKFSQKVLYSTLSFLVLGIVLSFFFTSKLAMPLKSLQVAAHQIGEGEFGTQIKDESRWNSKEITLTLNSFNQMSKKIVELQQQNETLKNREHLYEITEISKGLAHTIRNPLNTLNLAIDELSESQQEDKKHEFTVIAKNQIKRIDGWVKSLMDLMTSKDELLTQVCPLNIVQSVVDDFKLADTKGLTFEIIDNNTQGQIKGVESELKGLIHSLIANAVEASPNKETIQLTLSQSNDSYELQVRDHGSGFSEKILSNLFTPHNTNKTYGAGMGLYLAHRISKYKYQGDLTVANQKPQGSLVTLTFQDRG
ncbi:sensor histidine kinase [Aliikangiella marina]|nr:HAMP domain-containing sensor histidine kinase [Aliikangiella marina]